MKRCDVPPVGWICARKPGHHGPYAPHRIDWFTKHYTWHLPIWLCLISIGVATLFDLACPALDARARSYVVTRGIVSATEQELDECYFKIGQWTMLVLHPNGEPCKVLRGEFIGKDVSLMVVVEELR